LLFFYIFKQFCRFSGVTICNQLRIRRLDTWRHRARDHSTCHRPLGLPTYRRSIITKSVYPAALSR